MTKQISNTLRIACAAALLAISLDLLKLRYYMLKGRTDVIACVVVIGLFAFVSADRFGRLRRVLGMLDRNKIVLFLLLAMIQLIPALRYVHFRGYPQPWIPDEFSYLLIGKTFALGHLTNPAPQPAACFESFQTLVYPTYTGRYPPGQSLALAIGLLIGGQPIVGVWITSCILGFATYWMLRGWLPGRWAAVGAIIGALNPELFFWSVIILGGQVAMLGGALLLGAVGRFASKGCSTRLSTPFLCGLGIALFPFSRPYEGLLLAVISGLFLLRAPGPARLVKRLRALSSGRRLQWFGAFLLPIVVSLALTGIYDRAVTGNPLVLPHRLYYKFYESNPVLPWETKIVSHHFNNDPMRLLDNELIADYKAARVSNQAHIKAIFIRLRDLSEYEYTSAVMVFGFCALCVFFMLGRFSYKDRLAAAIAVVFMLILTQSVFGQWQYSAPINTMFLVVAMRGAYRLSLARRNKSARDRVYGGAAATMFLSLFSLFLAVRISSTDAWILMWWLKPYAVRSAFQADMEKTAANKILLVRYGPHHNYHRDWIENEPDIDHSRVIWARDLSPELDAQVVQNYPGREVYRVTVDDDNTRPLVQRLDSTTLQPNDDGSH